MNLIKTLVIGAIATGFISCGGEASTGTVESATNVAKTIAKEETKKPVVVKKETGLYAIFHTSKGDIKVGLQFELTPMTVGNFVALAKGEMPNDDKPDGEPFYNGLKFHRVIKDFMIQGGCPQGSGQGNPGYAFADEIVPELVHDGPGVLSMANSGPATNGSQFFITHKETPWLNGKHTVFGYVVSGQDVVNQIAQDDIIESIEIVAETDAAKAFKAKETFDTTIADSKKKEAAKILAATKAFDDYISNNHPNATKTESGLYYDITSQGNGKQAEAGKLVSVNYVGKFLDGKVFDTSLEAIAKESGSHNPQRQYKPIEFPVGQRRVIPGWDEGLLLLKEGDKASFIIPAHLAYGSRGAGPIAPNTPLVFDVELMAVKEMPKQQNIPQQKQ